MYARLQLLGDGSEENGYRVDLPSYTTVSVNYDDMWAVVSFGSKDGPPSLPPMGSPLYPQEGSIYVLIGLEPNQLAAWWQRLATRYPFRQPPYAPDFP